MNIYEKLIEIRSSITMKKDGQGYGYKYYQLEDILNQYKPLAQQYKVMEIFNLFYNTESDKYNASIKFVNAEKPEDFYAVQIDLPLAVVKGASQAQCVGSTRTYAYRYMLMTALGVAENDDPDNQHNRPVPHEEEKTKEMLKEQTKTKIIDEIKVLHQNATEEQKEIFKTHCNGAKLRDMSLAQVDKAKEILGG